MIIETARKNMYGRTIRIGSKEYTFDKKGKVKIEDETEAKKLIEGFEFLYEEGKVPITDNKGKELDPEDKETAEYLQQQLKIANNKIETQKRKIEQLKKEVEVWKEQCDKLLKGEKIETKEEEKEEEKSIKDELENKTLDELKEMYKMAGGNLQGIRTKEQVIKKLLELDNE